MGGSGFGESGGEKVAEGGLVAKGPRGGSVPRTARKAFTVCTGQGVVVRCGMATKEKNARKSQW